MLGCSAAFFGTILLSATSGLGLPFGVPPTPEDPALARIAPEDCLAYLSWAGTASPDPKSGNQTEQLLAEPEVQNFMRQIAGAFRGVWEEGEKNASDEDKESSKESYELFTSISTHPGALYLSKLEWRRKPAENPASDIQQPNANADSDPAELEARIGTMERVLKTHGPKTADQPREQAIAALQEVSEIEGGLVLALGDDASRFESLVEKSLERDNHPANSAKSDESESKDAKPENPAHQIEKIQIDGQDWYRCKCEEVKEHWLFWGFRKGYFIAAVGKEDVLPRLLQRMEADPPSWWKAIAEQAPVERRTLVGYANLRRIRELVFSQLDGESRSNAQMAAEILGFDNVTALVEVWGLDGDNFVNKTFLALEGDPRGLLRAISEEPLKAADFAPIPRDATSAMAFRVDLKRLLETVLDAAEKTNPENKVEWPELLREFETTLGIDLRQGILDALGGDAWSVYNSPSEGNYLTVVKPVKNGAAFKLASEHVVKLLRERLDAEEKSEKESDKNKDAESEFSPRIDRFEFEGQEIYCFNGGDYAPAWCITDREIVIGLLPQDVKAYLMRGNRHEPLGEDAQVAKLLEGDRAPSFLFYANPRSLFRFGYSWLLLMGPAFAGEMHEYGVDVSMLPPLPAIDRHLGPTVATVRRTAQGIEFASRGAIPLPVDAASVIAVAFSCQNQALFNVGSDLLTQALYILVGEDDEETGDSGKESKPASDETKPIQPPASDDRVEESSTPLEIVFWRALLDEKTTRQLTGQDTITPELHKTGKKMEADKVREILRQAEKQGQIVVPAEKMVWAEPLKDNQKFLFEKKSFCDYQLSISSTEVCGYRHFLIGNGTFYYRLEPKEDSAKLTLFGRLYIGQLSVVDKEKQEKTYYDRELGSSAQAIAEKLEDREAWILFTPMTSESAESYCLVTIAEAVRARKDESAYVRTFHDTKKWIAGGPEAVLAEVRAARQWEIRTGALKDAPLPADAVYSTPEGDYVKIVAVGQPNRWPYHWWNVRGVPIQGDPAWQRDYLARAPLAIVISVKRTSDPWEISCPDIRDEMEKGNLGWGNITIVGYTVLVPWRGEKAIKIDNYADENGQFYLVLKHGVGPWTELTKIREGEEVAVDGGRFKLKEVKAMRTKKIDHWGITDSICDYSYDPMAEVAITAVNFLGKRTKMETLLGSATHKRDVVGWLGSFEMDKSDIDHFTLLKRSMTKHVFQNISLNPNVAIHAPESGEATLEGKAVAESRR